jgi:hypothetical protein
MGGAHVGHEPWMLLRVGRMLRHCREMGEEFAQWRRLTHVSYNSFFFAQTEPLVGLLMSFRIENYALWVLVVALALDRLYTMCPGPNVSARCVT